MNRFLLASVATLFISGAQAASLNIIDGGGATQHLNMGGDSGNLNPSSSAAYVISNPTSTLTLTATTTAYAIGNLIASSATAGSVVVPSFSIPNTAGGFYAPRMRLTTNDSTSTAWGSAIVQVDLWTAAPTFTNGDRAAFAVATGTATHLAAYSCTFSSEGGDGAYAECAPTVGTVPSIRLATGTSVFWTLKAVTVSGVTGASKVFTLTAELSN